MGQYDDIINLDRPISKKHRPMPIENRAPQFAPFAALTGYDDVVEETARLTDRRIELSEEEKVKLDEKIAEILAISEDKLTIMVRYFVKDQNKEGGEYVSKTGVLKKIDSTGRVIIFKDGTVIALEDVFDVEIQSMSND